MKKIKNKNLHIPADIEAVNSSVIKNIRVNFRFFWLLVSGLFLLFFVYNIFIFNKSLPNIFIGKHDFSLQSRNDVQLAIDDAADNFEKFPITFIVDNKKIEILPENIGIKIDRQATSKKIMSIGRSGNIFLDFKTRISSIFFKSKVKSEFSVDLGVFSNKLDGLFGEFEIEPKNANITISGSNFIVTESKAEDVINRTDLAVKVRNSAEDLRFDEIYINKINKEPILTKSGTNKAYNKVTNLGSSNIKLTFGFDVWQLSKKDLFNLLSFKIKGFENENFMNFSIGESPIYIRQAKIASENSAYELEVSLNNEEIDAYIFSIAKVVDKSSHDASIRFENGKVIEFSAAQDGQELDRLKTKELILAKISTENPLVEENININLPVKVTPAKIANEEINNLGIKELIARGVSYFAGSIPNRVHNLTLGSNLISGTLVPPGETFSFTSLVGPVSAEQGFKQAYVISKGRTVLDDGGGICQVSTTVYRAALNAGFPILERTAHAYRVGYYEQKGFGPGLDATIFSPTVDLKFKNDTNKHILVQAIVDRVNSRLQVDIYGTSDGRKVEVSNPVILSQSPPPAPLYQDDPTLPKGTVKQVDFPAYGAKTYFTRKVLKNNQTIIDERVNSNFRPWQAVYLVGTGG